MRKRSKNWSLLDRFGYVDNMILISDHVRHTRKWSCDFRDLLYFILPWIWKNPWKNKIGERRANKVRRRSWRIEESMEMDKKSSSENWLRKSSRWLIVSMGNRDSNWSFKRKSWNVCVRSLSNSKDLRKRNQWLVQKRVFTHQRYRLRSEFINQS